MKTNSQQSLKRGLKNRHLQMIALGGAIGTGLFYGSASTIQLAGPAISLSYLIGGCVIFFIMRMLGEMAVDNPVSGSFSSYANTYWHEFVGFLSGWNYCAGTWHHIEYKDEPRRVAHYLHAVRCGTDFWL